MVRRFLVATGCLLVALFSAQPVAADWHTAETRNLVIHADLEKDELRQVALHMEEFARLLDQQMPTQLRPGRKFELWLDHRSHRISKIFGHRIFSGGRDWHDLPGWFAQYDRQDSQRHRYYPLYAAYATFHLGNGFELRGRGQACAQPDTPPVAPS